MQGGREGREEGEGVWGGGCCGHSGSMQLLELAACQAAKLQALWQ